MAALQERITSTKNGSITSLQAVFVPADDYTDPAPATTFAHLDSTIRLERAIAELGIYPAVDPLTSTSRVLDPNIVGQDHYDVARETQRVLQRFQDLEQIIAILGIDELSEEDKATVARARRLQRFMSQPFFVAEVFTGREGKYVPIKDTVASFKEILEGKVDTLPEQAFFLAGTIDDVKANADRLQGGSGSGGSASGGSSSSAASISTTPAAPAKDEPPPKAEAVAAKEEEAPANDEPAPAKAEAAPAKDEEAPAKDEAAPAKDEAAPAKDEEAPAKDEAAPAKDEAAPEPASGTSGSARPTDGESKA